MNFTLVTLGKNDPKDSIITDMTSNIAQTIQNQHNIFTQTITWNATCISSFLSQVSRQKAQREQREDRWICQLQTLQPSGMNIELGAYGREMYASYAKTY